MSEKDDRHQGEHATEDGDEQPEVRLSQLKESVPPRRPSPSLRAFVRQREWSHRAPRRRLHSSDTKRVEKFPSSNARD
jgi:hypothetical protein